MHVEVGSAGAEKASLNSIIGAWKISLGRRGGPAQTSLAGFRRIRSDPPADSVRTWREVGPSSRKGIPPPPPRDPGVLGSQSEIPLPGMSVPGSLGGPARDSPDPAFRPLRRL